MESVVVYIGSEYVIKTPDYDFQKNSLRVSANRKEAERHACRHNTVGILNTYKLDLSSLHISPAENDQAASADVVLSGEFLSLQSERALRALSFITAGFVCH